MTDETYLRHKWMETVDKSNHIWTWTENLTMCWLAEEASKAKLAVELGVYLGRTSKVMLDANPRLHLWSVDAALVAGVWDTSRYFLRQEIADGRCEMIRGDSEVAARMLAYCGPTLDMVWVDDGHATEDVKRDIRCFLPLLKPGGLLCGHDFEQNPFNDVAQGVIASLPHYSIECPRLWVYRKP